MSIGLEPLTARFEVPASARSLRHIERIRFVEGKE